MSTVLSAALASAAVATTDQDQKTRIELFVATSTDPCTTTRNLEVGDFLDRLAFDIKDGQRLTFDVVLKYDPTDHRAPAFAMALMQKIRPRSRHVRYFRY